MFILLDRLDFTTKVQQQNWKVCDADYGIE
jgi:hypothetical protein